MQVSPHRAGQAVLSLPCWSRRAIQSALGSKLSFRTALLVPQRGSTSTQRHAGQEFGGWQSDKRTLV